MADQYLYEVRNKGSLDIHFAARKGRAYQAACGAVVTAPATPTSTVSAAACRHCQFVLTRK